MKNCGTCKHWQRPESNQLHGVCGAIPMTEKHNPEPECLNALAYTEDMERYASNLHTKSDFGCVLHEPIVIELR